MQYLSFHDQLRSFSITWTFGWFLPLALVSNVAVSFDVKYLLSLLSVLLSIFLLSLGFSRQEYWSGLQFPFPHMLLSKHFFRDAYI